MTDSTNDPLDPGISAIIPVYNSEQSLPRLIERLEPVLRKTGRPFQAILVNDGSRDGSWETIQQLAAEHPWIRGVCLMRNYGQHNALLCGIRQACYDTIVTLDDDLQNPPEEIPTLLHKLDEGFDVVYGRPREEKHGLCRDMASRITKLMLQKAMGAETARSISAFRAFHTHIRDAFESYRSPYVSIDVLLTWGTTRFAAIGVRHEARELGKSNYTLRKLLAHALNMVTGFSTWPLQMTSLLGFLLTLFGIGLLGFTLLRYFTSGTRVPGFAFLASVMTLFSGAQMFALGIIGEYLARLHMRTMDRPIYMVRQETGQHRKADCARDNATVV